MNIHEYQAKAVLKEFGAPVSRGAPAFTPDEAQAVAEELGGPVWVVKGLSHGRAGPGRGGPA
jgi:succinyl-CoA synthetase beta subunit